MRKISSFEKLLALFVVCIIVLISARIIYSGNRTYLFLLWNIFLAWVPFFFSKYLSAHKSTVKWKQFVLLAAWLLFFPNSLYIITDLVHLQNNSVVPKWFDVILIFSSAIVGLLMAFASLSKVEEFLNGLFNKRKVAALVMLFLFLGSFGVYLGRFLRWNSWNIINTPFSLLSSVVQRFVFPFEHLRTWGITFILTVVFYLLYLSIKKLPGYLNQAV
jgi:uncharacterized membrane protein